MARSLPLLIEAQWKKIAPLLPRRPSSARVAARGSTIAVSWKGFCGYCGAALAGRTCRRRIRTLPRAGGGCATGRSRACG